MRQRKQQGITLILVIWVIGLLMVIAVGVSKSVRVETNLARNQRELAQVRALAEAGVQRGLYELTQPNFDPERWKADGRALEWETDGAKLTIRAIDESARIDLNTANEGLLRGLFKVAGSLSDDEAAAQVDKIVDWRDADELKRVNGAEAEDYRAAERKRIPSNSAFVSVAELQHVLGVTPALYAAVAPFLTVYSRQAGVNVALASKTVLLSIPNVTAEAVEAYLETRRDALLNNTPLPALPGASPEFVGAGSRSIRLQVAVTLDSGMKDGREAIIRLQPYRGAQGPEWLAWRDLVERIDDPSADPRAASGTDLHDKNLTDVPR